MTIGRDPVIQAWWCLVAGGLPFCLYLRTIAPTVYALDSAELTTGAYVLGIVHAPGTPTYLLLGHLFSWLPFGDIGYRLNLMSACAAAVTSSLFYLLACRLVHDRALALGGAWLLATSYYFWINALMAELYAPQVCFATALLLLALQWQDVGGTWRCCAAGLLFGLGLGVHLALVLMVPGLVWLLLAGPLPRQRRLAAGLFLAVAVFFCIGASVYAYLPLRYMSDTPLNYARDYWQVDLTTARGFLWMVTARMFAGSFFGIGASALPGEIGLFGWRLVGNFVGLGALLGILGLVEGLRDRPRFHVGLLLMFAGHTIFFIGYAVADKELMFLPAYLVWTVWIVLGARRLGGILARELGERWAVPGSVLLMFLAAGNTIASFHRVDLSDDWSARLRGERILNHMPAGAIYLGTWADVPILEYLQIVESRRPDVEVRNLLFMGPKGARVASGGLAAGHRVYTSAPRLLPSEFLAFTYHEKCACYAVRAESPPAVR